MLLSILIATLEARRGKFDRLLRTLNAQVELGRLADEVEILFERDDGSMPTGQKRNHLIARAQGQFIVSVDDDDEVHERYVQLIVEALRANPHVDVLGIWGEVRFRGRHCRRFNMSVRNHRYATVDGVYLRPPHHLNPMRREIAQRYPFEPVWKHEDSEWALRMVRDGALQREFMLDEPIYSWASRRNFWYQALLDRTEWFRHPLGLVAVNHVRFKRWIGSQSR